MQNFVGKTKCIVGYMKVADVRQERSTIEEITKTLNEVHFPSSIKLNVGGNALVTGNPHPDTPRRRGAYVGICKCLDD